MQHHGSAEHSPEAAPFLLRVAAVQVSLAVRDSLTVRAADFGIVLEDIAITHLSFGTEFTRVRGAQLQPMPHVSARGTAAVHVSVRPVLRTAKLQPVCS
jgi:hypothetical protein